MWCVISYFITLPGLVVTCAPHWSVSLHGGGGTSTAWQGVSAVAADQSLKEEACSGNRTPIARQGVKRRGKRRAIKEKQRRETLMAPRSPFYKPRTKGGVMTEKRHAVACILLLDLGYSSPSHALPEPSALQPLLHGSRSDMCCLPAMQNIMSHFIKHNQLS